MSIPFALSLDKYVNQAGTDVGFGCLLAVALLALLYFAGARETRTLREQLEEAHERITSLEARVTQALRNQAAARAQAAQPAQVPSVPGRPGVVPAPSVAQSTNSAAARVQRQVSATTVTGVLLGAPEGAGAPALGSATKLIPSPEMTGVPAPSVGVPAAVPVAATAAGGAVSVPSATEAYAGSDDEDFDDFEPDDTMFVPAGVTAAANGGAGGGGAAVAPAPSVRFGEDGPLGPPPRRTVPLVEYGPSGQRRISRMLGGLIALLVVAAIMVALLVITGNGGSKSKTTTATRGTVTKRTTKPVAFNPAKVKVSVLNGTGQQGLAGDVATLVKKSGYTVPSRAITNADTQLVSTTTVGYRPGYRADAFRVAKSLTTTSGVTVTDVVAASSTSVTSCATPTATGQVGTCPAGVIVTVGTDMESAATNSTSG
jgi:hypothetical protein